MPIRELSLELVHDIVESYGQITKLNLSTNGETALLSSTSVCGWMLTAVFHNGSVGKRPCGLPAIPDFSYSIIFLCEHCGVVATRALWALCFLNISLTLAPMPTNGERHSPLPHIKKRGGAEKEP